MNKHPFDKQAKKLEKVFRNLPSGVGTVIVSETKENFRRQGFYSDGRTGRRKKWKERKSDAPRNRGRALLLDSGVLRRSIRKEVRGFKVRIFSDVPYAAVHNDGLMVRKRTSKRRGYKSRRKGGATFQMTQRKFLGDHPALRRKVTAFMTRQIERAFK